MARDTEAIKERTRQRHERIRARFKQLYDVKRVRVDDVIEMLCDEYGYAEITIKRIVGI